MQKNVSKLLKFMSLQCLIVMMIQVLTMQFLVAGDVKAQSLADTKFSANIRNKTLVEIFRTIEKKTEYVFAFPEGIRNSDTRFSFTFRNEGLDKVLLEMSEKTRLKFQVIDMTITAAFGDRTRVKHPVRAPTPEIQPSVISGTVRDEQSNPLPGVNILLKGTATGTTADADGKYVITVPDNDAVLVFSFIGYQSQEIAVMGQTAIDVVLVPDTKTLQEVVVVGYGTQRKEDITGAINSVSEKDFEGQPITRVDQALQGRVTGVQVTNASGSPGGAVRIRIRGANSLSGDNDPLYVVDGFVGADFNTINPEDVATIDVLKDASATAIYGSRGANGVVIITTKSGKAGEMKIDFGTRFYSSRLIKKYNTLNAADFATVANERALALTPEGGTYVPRFSEEEIESFRQNGGTDWQEEIFRTAPGQEYQLGISGGNEKATYLLSVNYLDQDGIVLNSDFKRYSVRTNIRSQVSQKFSVRFNFMGTRRENMNSDGTGQRNGVLGQALAWAPTTPVYDAAGNYILVDPTSSLFANPVAMALETEYRAENTNANILTGLNYEILPGLTFDVQLGLNYLNAQGKNFQGPPATLSWANAGRSSNENITWQNTNTLNYKRTFNAVHNVDVTLVLEAQKFTGTGFNVNVSNLTYPAQSYNNLSLSASSIVGSGYSSWALLSQLGRINYAYKDKYLVSAAVRRDGSSKFQGDNKYSIFPSAAVGWRITSEDFMESAEVVSDLKLRASWGLTGNQGIGAYGTLSAYVTHPDDAGVVFNGNGGPLVTGILMGNPGNLDLRWETTEQVDVGADIDLWDGKVGLSADYFVKSTRDLLMLRGLPGYIGGYSIQSNIGEIRNKGWEFSIRTTPVQTSVTQWTSTFNISTLENTVISLGTDRDTIPLGTNVLIPGESMNSLYGLKFLGTWKPHEAAEAQAYGLRPGDARYEDIDNNGVINEKDHQVIGNGMPRLSMGWNNTFSYRNLSLNVFFQGLFGFDKLNYTYANGMLASTDAKEIIFDDIRQRYTPGVNETSDIPAFSAAGSNAFIQSSRFVEKGNFIRLKNVSLTYTLPKPYLKDVAVVRFFVGATNLLTITDYKGIDPESNSSAVSGLTWDNFGTDVQQGIDHGSYPNARTYTAGINFTF